MSKKIRRSMFLALTALAFAAFGCDDSTDNSGVSEKEQNCINKGGKVYDDNEDKCYCQIDGNLQELTSGKCSDLAAVTGDCNDGDAPKCDGDFVVTCADKAWQKAEEKCEFGCDNGACKDKEDPPSETCTDGDIKCDGDFVSTCSEGLWNKAADKCSNGCEKGVCLEEPVETCTEGEQRCSDDYVQKCFNKHWVNASLKCPEGCGGNECKGDLNHNYMKDEFDLKDGKACSKYADCDSGLCDSFIGYKCSNKCTEDSQCISDEYYCRKDGRCVPKAFVTEWKIDNHKKIKFPLKEASECKLTIQWGDGKSDETNECKDIEHEYAEAGTYRISITGTLDGWKSRGDSADSLIGDYYVLLKVISFGPVRLGFGSALSVTEGVFYFADHLTELSFIDIPDASKLTSTVSMFQHAKLFNSPIENWDMSNVTNISGMFEEAVMFNQPIEHWDTSSVKNMECVFEKASAFNQPINNWDVSNVTNMRWLFYGAESYNQPLNNWNVSKVTDMRWMFLNAKSFNQAIGNWDVSSVDDMDEMFSGAENFNQDISKWNTSKVEKMGKMFKEAKKFNQNIGNWDVSKVRVMSEMFYYAEAFDQDLSKWKLDALMSQDLNKDIFTGSNLSKENYCKLMSESADAKWKEYIDVLGLKNKYSCD